MAIAQRQGGPQQAFLAGQGGGRGPSGLADVLEVLLDKGLVIDAFVRVSLVGIELLTVDARIVVASVDTYLRFAEAVNRLDLLQAHNSQTVGDLLGGGSKSGDDPKAARALSSAAPEPDEATDEPSQPGASNDEAAEAPASQSEQDDDTTGNDDEDKGLLSRIKERGQVF